MKQSGEMTREEETVYDPDERREGEKRKNKMRGENKPEANRMWFVPLIPILLKIVAK